ncbi:hypothetical protein C8R43DRAFT_1113345 [Mycena crocata]|nr:hypothetical protein C8R43DRAFT_1113345 [Mycena crocata]
MNDQKKGSYGVVLLNVGRLRERCTCGLENTQRNETKRGNFPAAHRVEVPLVGRLDIVQEMVESGEFQQVVAGAETRRGWMSGVTNLWWQSVHGRSWAGNSTSGGVGFGTRVPPPSRSFLPSNYLESLAGNCAAVFARDQDVGIAENQNVGFTEYQDAGFAETRDETLPAHRNWDAFLNASSSRRRRERGAGAIPLGRTLQCHRRGLHTGLSIRRRDLLGASTRMDADVVATVLSSMRAVRKPCAHDTTRGEIAA